MDHWHSEILARFYEALINKMNLLQIQPEIGIRNSKYSKFRKTLIANQYILTYSLTEQTIIIYRLKHKKRE